MKHEELNTDLSDTSTPTEPADAIKPAAAKQLSHIAKDIKISHSVFAMPFAILGGFMAAKGLPELWQIGLIVICMILARTFAMCVNRWADAHIDKENPRTAGRAIPAGRVTRPFMGGFDS